MKPYRLRRELLLCRILAGLCGNPAVVNAQAVDRGGVELAERLAGFAELLADNVLLRGRPARDVVAVPTIKAVEAQTADELIDWALKATGNDVRAAAGLLGITERGLRYRLRRLRGSSSREAN